MKFLLAVLLSTFVVAACAPAAPDWSAPQSQVKLIKGLNGNCSGVVVAPGLVLTAKHCADLAFPTVDGKVATIVREAPAADLLLLQVDVACPCAVMDTNAIVGERAIVVGYPFGDVLHYTQVTTEGIAWGVVQPGGNVGGIGEALVLTVPVGPGNSGGGVFVLHDGVWVFVGILVAGAESTSLAVSLDTVKAFLKT